MNNINPIGMKIPQEIVSLGIEANRLQMRKGGESKHLEVQRLQYQVGEMMCAIISEECKRYNLK